MKTTIICLLIIITSSLLYSQSSFVSDIGTILDVGSGSDICSDVITINGTLTGSGTFCNAPLAVEVDTPLVPNKFELLQNYPNPFNSSSVIKYLIPKSSQVTLKIFNTLGEEIITLVNAEKAAGTYEVNWNAADLPSGVYLFRLKAGDFVQTRKMILLK